MLPDPPLLRLEAEASQAYLSVLLHVQAVAPDPVKAACTLEARLTQLCLRWGGRACVWGESMRLVLRAGGAACWRCCTAELPP